MRMCEVTTKKAHWCGSLHSGKTTLRRRQMQAGQMVAQPLAERVERLLTSWTECWTQTCQNNQKSDRLRKHVEQCSCRKYWEHENHRTAERFNASLIIPDWIQVASWLRSNGSVPTVWAHGAAKDLILGSTFGFTRDLSDWICKINCWINAKKKLHSNYVYKRIISKSYMISIIVVVYANVWKYTYISYHIMLVTYYKSYL